MYKLLNTKWGDPTFGTPSGTINWQDDLGGLSVTGGTTNSLVSALNDAFTTWEGVAALDFNEAGGGISVTYESFSTDGVPFNDGAAATASWDLSGIQPVNPVITFNSDEVWSAYGGFGGVDFFAVALHEIGHVIGLDHPDTPFEEFRGEIMNSVVYADNLGNGDIAGAQIIYGTDGDDVPVDPDDGGGGRTGGDGGGGGGGGGLLLGLLALIIGIFSGGVGAAAMVAAARVADDEDDVADAGHSDHDGHEHDHIVTGPDGTVSVTHVTFVPDLPLIEFDEATFGDGDDEDDAPEYFMI